MSADLIARMATARELDRQRLAAAVAGGVAAIDALAAVAAWGEAMTMVEDWLRVQAAVCNCGVVSRRPDAWRSANEPERQ